MKTERFDILLTRKGEEVKFEFAPAKANEITQFTFLKEPQTKVNSEQELCFALRSVIGSQPVALKTPVKSATIISFHEVAILGYDIHSVIDPRLDNKIAELVQVYVDNRLFPLHSNESWQSDLTSLIWTDGPAILAEKIKQKLVEQASHA